LLFDAQLGTDYLSYRAYRLPWIGSGEGRPSIAAARSGRGTKVWASWNGDMRTRFWVLLAGGAHGPLMPAGARPRAGFETALTLRGDVRRVAVRALALGGQTLGESETLAV
jgi:hypothetical protein